VSVELSGLDGANPLAFLAALGALDLASEGLGSEVGLAWRGEGRRWRPVVSGIAHGEALVQAILDGHAGRDLKAELGWERDVMSLTREQVRAVLSERLDAGNRRAAETAAACATELPLRRNSDGRVAYTPFRLIPRMGRARFLSTAKDLSGDPEATALTGALFGPWRYVKANNLRLDPDAIVPARAYTAEAPTYFGPLAVPGAMLLAVAALRFFPLMLARGHGACRGFGWRTEAFVWPLWRESLPRAAVRILLGLPALYEDEPDADVLRRHGVEIRLVAARHRLGSDSEMLARGAPVRRAGGAR
jgi:hypothetical protein